MLRGPQERHGKNTTGGAINFITHKPGFTTEGDIKVGGATTLARSRGRIPDSPHSVKAWRARGLYLYQGGWAKTCR